MTTSGLAVIGAGFGRTGTESLKQALEILGFGHCYHMFELMAHPEGLSEWEKLGRGERPDYDALFEGYRSTCDFPACLYYRELMAEFPEAKVVLTVRDPQRWYDSARRTILRRFPRAVLPLVRVVGLFSKTARSYPSVARFAVSVVHDGIFEGRPDDRDFAVGVFERWRDEVIATVPPEKLLVFQVADGWEPLCDFLAVPVPERPFPRTNDGDSFDRNLVRRLLGRRSAESPGA